MKKAYLLLLTLVCIFCACSSDDPQPVLMGPKNENANLRVVNGVTEYSPTDLTKMAQRLEMPRLKGGTDNIFVCHTLKDGSVNYCMEYDCSRLAARWAAYQWYAGMSSHDGSWNRNSWKYGDTFNGYGGTGDPFQPDPLLPREYRTELDDHRSNGYDRGHMLGSADRLNTKEANGQTFYLSNMHPQLNSFNAQGIWFTLEEKLRKQYDISSFRDTLYVVKGGTIADGQYSTVRGASGRRLPVPKHFFMALLCKNKSQSQGGYKAIAFWMEHKANTATNPASYAISIDQLEENTGIDFFCNLPDDIERTVESNLSLAAWGLK